MFSSIGPKLKEGSNIAAAYALFNKSRYVAILLSLLIACEIINICICVSETVPSVSFETICILVPVPKRTMTYGIIVPITQTTLVGSIIFKSVLARYSGWGRTPLVSLLIREGVGTYLLMTSEQCSGYAICTH
ncbi:hypothetical protein PAXINDRAFT_66815 [Paxillus involutus ATCC 200175]|nr:hypothetical protein PAXINDRAFT_66815 [Paxillus involutus ATCC 200175]